MDKEPGPGIDGHKHKECRVCGETLESESIEALPDDNDDPYTSDLSVIFVILATVSMVGFLVCAFIKPKRFYSNN